MTVTTTPLCLGLDPSQYRVGWAFYTLPPAEPKPLWCGTNSIDEPHKGWRDQQIAHLMTRLRYSLDSKIPEAHYQVLVVAVEQMYAGPNPQRSLELANVAGQVSQAARHTWPDARILTFLPPVWRQKAGLKRSATKAEVREFALKNLGVELPPHHKLQKPDWVQDAADASVIAYVGHLEYSAQATSQPNTTTPAHDTPTAHSLAN